MHQHVGMRQRRLELVMIRDDQFQPQPPRLVRLGKAGNAAIDGDDGFDPALRQLP